MWQRFTERARRVILLAQEEAGKMSSGHVGTEHILLGLVRENDSVAAQLLEKMGVLLPLVREAVEAIAESDTVVGASEPILTRQAKRVLELAADEARQIHHNYIGTEHLLLALLREDGAGASVLRGFGLDLESVRQQLIEYIGLEGTAEDSETAELSKSRVVVSSASVVVDFHLTPEVMLLLGLAAIEAKKQGETLLSPRHLLKALVANQDGEVAQLLQAAGLDFEKARVLLG